MSDLIRRKDVLEYLGWRIQMLDQPGDYMLRIECEIIRDFVEDDVPAVDAVPVVMCKDCKRRGTSYECPFRHLDYTEAEGYHYVDCTTDEGYCSFGERKDTDERI